MTEPTKRCVTCKQSRPLSEFNVRRAARDGLQPRCRPCSKAWYAENRTAHMAHVRVNRKSMIDRNRLLLADYLLQHPCVDCGEADVRCLDFDHRSPVDKTDDVARLIGNAISWARIQAEIGKCDVRCANCHRRVTVERGGWWRQAVFEAQVRTLSATTTARLEALLPAR